MNDADLHRLFDLRALRATLSVFQIEKFGAALDAEIRDLEARLVAPEMSDDPSARSFAFHADAYFDVRAQNEEDARRIGATLPKSIGGIWFEWHFVKEVYR